MLHSMWGHGVMLKAFLTSRVINTSIKHSFARSTTVETTSSVERPCLNPYWLGLNPPVSWTLIVESLTVLPCAIDKATLGVRSSPGVLAIDNLLIAIYSSLYVIQLFLVPNPYATLFL